MRDFEVNVLGETRLTEANLGESWLEVIEDRDVVAVSVCEFGLAEEVIAMIAFADGSFEVGIGESLRPYIVHYKGDDRNEAHAVWWTVVRKAADWLLAGDEKTYFEEFVEERMSDTIQAVADKFGIQTDEVHDYLTRETIEESSKAGQVYKAYHDLLDRQWKAFIA